MKTVDTRKNESRKLYWGDLTEGTVFDVTAIVATESEVTDQTLVKDRNFKKSLIDYNSLE